MKKNYVVIVSILYLFSCSTPNGTIQSKVQSSAIILDEEFETIARIGNLPINVNTNKEIERYGIRSQGRPTEYILVVNPSKVDGAINIDNDDVPKWVESVGSYSGYIDKLLQAHRKLLNGEIDEAESILNLLTNEFNQGFGTAVLLANIAILKGDYKNAARFYKMASKLNPEGVDPSFVPGNITSSPNQN